jgi:sphinganine-1-phosphate aldolase
LEKTREEVRAKMKETLKEGRFKKMEFRSNGQDFRSIMNKLSSMNNMDKETIGGKNTKITGTIYVNDGDIESLVGEVVRMYGYSNLLHPDLFSSARFLEAELIKLTLDLFNGDKNNSCGITTTGGTESILFACLAYRNRGYKMGIKRPEM